MKKTIELISLSTFLFVFFVIVCCKKAVKHQSSIKGKITYIDYTTGDTLDANGVMVSLLNASLTTEFTTSTDVSGNYQFSTVKDGDHFIDINASLGLYTYKGRSSVGVTGDEMRTVNLILKH